MANFWGKAWAKAWGNAWGADTAAETASATLTALATVNAQLDANRAGQADILGVAAFDSSATKVVFSSSQLTAIATALFDGEVVTADPFVTASMEGRAFVQAYVVPDKLSGTGYKNLWTPIRTAKTEEVKLKQTTKVKFETPVAEQTFTLSADTLATGVGAGSNIGSEVPTTGAMPPQVAATSKAKTKRKKPKAHAKTAYVRAISTAVVHSLPPIPEVVAMPVPIKGKTYHAHWTPETVKNPTAEMLMIL